MTLMLSGFWSVMHVKHFVCLIIFWVADNLFEHSGCWCFDVEAVLLLLVTFRVCSLALDSATCRWC